MKNVFEKPVFFGNVALRSVVSGILQESISAHPIERNSCEISFHFPMKKLEKYHFCNLLKRQGEVNR